MKLMNFYTSDGLRNFAEKLIEIHTQLDRAHEMMADNPTEAFRNAREAEKQYNDVTLRVGTYDWETNQARREFGRKVEQIMQQAYLNMGEDAPKILRGEFSMAAVERNHSIRHYANKILGGIVAPPPEHDYSFQELHI